MSYAGFWRRALALLVDLAVWVPMTVAYIAVEGLSIVAAMVSLVVLTALWIAYSVYFVARWGQTIGKMVAAIRIVRLDGAPATTAQAWLRSSVDIALSGIDVIAKIYVLWTWAGPDWSSLGWLGRGDEITKRSPVFSAIEVMTHVWVWSELVILLLNKKRRALHDFIAGTVVVRLGDQSSAQPSVVTSL